MRKRLAAACILAAYSAVLLKLIVFKGMDVRTGFIRIRLGGGRGGDANYLPFRTIWSYLHGGHGFIAVVNVLGNIVPLMPVGFLAPLVFRSMTWRTSVLIGLAFGLTFEATEAVFHVGIVDVDDVILNTLGVVLGYWTFVLMRTAGPGRERPIGP